MTFDSATLTEVIGKGQNIIVAGHVNPDGDAVGACFAVALSLSLAGKKPIILLEKFSERYGFLTGSEFIYTGDWSNVSGDIFISVDCGTKNRLGKAEAIFDNTPVTFNIDHHLSNDDFAMYNYTNKNASSTCEIIFSIVNNILPIDRDIASAIYAGMSFDTGGFRHNSTNPETMEIAANLMRMGIDYSGIQRNVLYVHTKAEAKAFGYALNNLQFVDGFPVSYTYLTIEQMKKAGADYTDLDSIVEYILNLEGIVVSVFFTERPNGEIKASFRSKEMDVNKLVTHYGGGGHKNASGATLQGSLENNISLILEDVKKELANG